VSDRTGDRDVGAWYPQSAWEIASLGVVKIGDLVKGTLGLKFSGFLSALVFPNTPYKIVSLNISVE